MGLQNDINQILLPCGDLLLLTSKDDLPKVPMILQVKDLRVLSGAWAVS